MIDAVRAQLADGDELLVAEPGDCLEPGLSPGESHRAVGAASDDAIHLWGMETARGDVVVQLEDHGVPGAGFLDYVRAAFRVHPDLDAQTYWLRNGTPVSLGSRVLFSYVAGLAEPGGRRAVPKPVCSSYALRRERYVALRDSGAVRAPGHLEYEVIPRLSNVGLTALPVEATLTHYQQNTIREALSAVHWNARAAGAMERGRPVLRRGAVMVRRYVGHVIRLQQDRPRPVDELVLLGACSVAGFSGWCVGRAWGPGAAVDRLKSAHPVAATPAISPDGSQVRDS